MFARLKSGFRRVFGTGLRAGFGSDQDPPGRTVAQTLAELSAALGPHLDHPDAAHAASCKAFLAAH